eukprot:NODE_3802_length_330_cov_1894.153025_g3131_i0.p1 GENE.NODE_3802_length_330_cov_1894.153025_g3131_i0~~NODE_3802_length_330_cov_1894.153025_g3131_i0.p1  ORF type:complete len:54 (-),score=1.05 NODE_3802_length_330_cov_1894.153025_g3131_i0:81-242(-)
MFELSRSYLTPHGAEWIRAWRELPDQECPFEVFSVHRTTNSELERTRGIRLFN